MDTDKRKIIIEYYHHDYYTNKNEQLAQSIGTKLRRQQQHINFLINNIHYIAHKHIGYKNTQNLYFVSLPNINN